MPFVVTAVLGPAVSVICGKGSGLWGCDPVFVLLGGGGDFV